MGKLGATLVVLLLIGLVSTATGPEWVVDHTTGTQVVCHQKFHAEHVKQVPIPATGTPKKGRTCPS